MRKKIFMVIVLGVMMLSGCEMDDTKREASTDNAPTKVATTIEITDKVLWDVWLK